MIILEESVDPTVRNITQNVLKSFSALLILTSLAWATDLPWKGKPYEQWTDKDVERVFTDSPWARTTTITRTWRTLTQKDLPNPTVSHTARTIPDSPGPGTDARGTESNIDVYWASSRVMRAASARKDALRGNTKGVDVEKYANEPQDEYQIVEQSDDMAPFFNHDENFFQANAFLEAKQNKQKILPSHIRYERDEKGVLVTSAIFFFPKKTPSGDPTIPSDEKNVEFKCKIEGSLLRVNFDLQKMVDNSGPAL
jgi:hypothetical protein